MDFTYEPIEKYLIRNGLRLDDYEVIYLEGDTEVQLNKSGEERGCQAVVGVHREHYPALGRLGLFAVRILGRDVYKGAGLLKRR